MVRASAQGHRVVLVTATRGEHGEVADGFLRPGETLAERRVQETAAAAAILGVHRHEFLGYVDSGMMGTPENDLPGSFWSADPEEAATRLAKILAEENAEVLTVYDAHGNYGHPDHIKVHQVGLRAAELAGTPRVYEATIDRDRVIELARQAVDDPSLVPEGSPVATMAKEMLDGGLENFGSPGSMITTRVDVTAYVQQKRDAMRAHASQIDEQSWFLSMPDDAFEMMFGTESFIGHGTVPADDLFGD